MTVPAAAQFYKYVDDEGNTRFTDDINLVPPEQRKNIKSYEESVSEPAEEEAGNVQEETQPAPKSASSGGSATVDDAESLEDARKRLDAFKDEIDAEYAALIEEKKKLAKEKEQAQNREQIIEYNKKVEDLNQKVRDYQQKGKDYETQVEAYNGEIAEQNAAHKKKKEEDQ